MVVKTVICVSENTFSFAIFVYNSIISSVAHKLKI